MSRDYKFLSVLSRTTNNFYNMNIDDNFVENVKRNQINVRDT